MKTTFTRRIVAAISAAGLLLVGAPLAAGPAQAATACAAGATCEGALTGSLGSTAFTIKMPTKFNGTVLMYSHGYRHLDADPGRPRGAARASRRARRTRRSRSRRSPRCSAPTWPTSGRAPLRWRRRPRSHRQAAGPGLRPGRRRLLAAGLGDRRSPSRRTSSSSSTSTPVPSRASRRSWRGATRSAASSAATVRGEERRQGRRPHAQLRRRWPVPRQAMNTAMTVLFSWKTLIAPSLRVANYTSYAPGAAPTSATVLQTLNGVGSGTVSTSSVGYPVAQANLLAGLMAGLPTASAVYDGITRQPGLRHPRHRRGTRRRLPAGVGGRELRGSHAPERRRCRRPGRHGPLRPRAEGPPDGGHPGDGVGEHHRQRARRLLARCSRTSSAASSATR